MVSTIEMNGILKDADKYVGEEVIMLIKGYVSNVELKNDIMKCMVGCKVEPMLLGQSTVIDLETTDVEIEIYDGTENIEK